MLKGLFYTSAALMLGFIFYDGLQMGAIGMPAKNAPDPCQARYLIPQKTKTEVARRLNAPGSIKDWQLDYFPVAGEACQFRAQGTFTATNAFGGRVQGAFIADVLAKGQTVHFQEIAVQ